MARRCRICSLAPVQRLAIEGMLSQGTSRRVLSKIVACSHVSIGRHYRKHMRYPPDWSKEIKMSVLKFASVRGPAIVDVFRERNWIGWAEYGNLLKRARNAGYDPGYQLTLAVMAWLSTKQEESRKLEVLVKYMPRPKPYL